MQKYIIILSLLLLVLSGCGPKQAGLSSAPQQVAIQFGGSYDQLEEPQKKLIDDWFMALGKMLGKTLPPHDGYNRMPLSTRTTFEAVTHALMNTELRDAEGTKLGTGINLIEHLETIRGHIPNVRGDTQFRIYVTLRPGAKETLGRNAQFLRGHDNTIYHHGYPYSYRLDGTPSAQFSVTEDFKRADIDVDYRSTTFPQVLFNGHLTAANSDVRAGNNYQTHVGLWDGLPNWWSQFLVFMKGSFRGEASSDGEFFIPSVPPVPKEAPVSDALYDYLNSWIVKREPRLAASYHSGSAISCFDPSAEENDELNLARYRIVSEMVHANELIGDIPNLEGTVSAIAPHNPAFVPVEHPYSDFFTLVHVPAEMASVLTCGALDHPANAHLLPLGEYYGALFEIKEGNNQLLDIFQLWGQDEKSWKIISFHFELEAREAISDLFPDRFEIPSNKLERVEAEPAFLEAVENLFRLWFQEGDLGKAMTFFGESCDHCPQHYQVEGMSVPGSAEEARSTILEKLKIIRSGVETGDQLSKSIRRVEPWNLELKVISHHQEDALTLVSVPDGIAKPLLCENRHRAHEINRSGEHENYFASIFQLNVRSDHPAVFILLWSRNTGGVWKIVSYHIETH